MRLLTDWELEQTWVVANSSMNRQRSLTGSNGYGRELGIDVLDVLRSRLRRGTTVRWLDVCCGSGLALLEAAAALRDRDVELTGIDLVGYFAGPDDPPLLRLVSVSALDWIPRVRYDLITAVHGLHYVGDKLALLARTARWLTEDGLFAASFDPHGMRFDDGTAPVRRLTADLRRQGFRVDLRNHRISRAGRADVVLPYQYLGANARPEPNYTGQDAVVSVYARAERPPGADGIGA